MIYNTQYPATSYRPFPPNQLDAGKYCRIMKGIVSIMEDTISLGVFLNIVIPE